MAWVLDCDGVIWLADEAIEGASEAVARLREAGERVIFLTNNSWPRVDSHVEKLVGMGIRATPEDVVTSSMAAARLVEPGERVLVLGGPGLHDELKARGAELIEPGEGDPNSIESVVVGMDVGFNYARLSAATTALREASARLIATNEDATFPTSRGLLPGAGSVVAAVATAGGVSPIVAGKPYQPVAEVLRDRVGKVSMMVGDRPSTDGRMARLLGVPFGLVLTGVTPAGHGLLDPAPDVEASDLRALVEVVLGGG
ncbi:MAG: HAD-IIA family hydrolase [Acidimicrobiales bacterium]|jgi:HAD superfamily hydrolase (TIGR01450 family)